MPGLPRQKPRIVSRYRSFHSDHAGRKVGELVALDADVPRLGDQLRVAQRRLRRDRFEERRVGAEAAVVPPEHRREIEAEAVDVHFLDPVAHAIDDQVAHRIVADRDRVAGAAAIDVLRRRFRLQPVVRRVVEAAQAERRSGLVALGGVIEDDVENHFDARGVQRLDHRLELRHRIVERVLRRRCEPRERVVAPIVREAFVGDEFLGDERLHRQQLHGRHAELLQVRDDFGPREPEVSAALALGDLSDGVS